MGRITAPKHVIQFVNELICWYETADSRNPLSYPSCSAEAKMGLVRAGIAKSIVPLLNVPRHLKPVDKAFKDMEEGLRVAVLCRHLADYQIYRLWTGESRSTFYKRVDAGYWFIAGVLYADSGIA